MRERRSMHILTAAIELYTYRKALSCSSKGGTGVPRARGLLQGWVTPEIPPYKGFFLQRTVQHSTQRASQHFGQKCLVFSVGKCVVFSYHQPVQQQFTSHLSSLSKSGSSWSPPERQAAHNADRAAGIFLSTCSIAIRESVGKSPCAHFSWTGEK